MTQCNNVTIYSVFVIKVVHIIPQGNVELKTKTHIMEG
jgi:hypothetical protein